MWKSSRLPSRAEAQGRRRGVVESTDSLVIYQTVSSTVLYYLGGGSGFAPAFTGLTSTRLLHQVPHLGAVVFTAAPIIDRHT